MNVNKDDSITTFTEGEIFFPLIKYTIPIILSLLVQSLYGAVDLFIIGKFAGPADISGISTGVQFTDAVLGVAGGFTTALTVLIAQNIGAKNVEGYKKAISTGICFFLAIGLVLAVVITIFTDEMVVLMNAPKEAYQTTFDYIRICGIGILFFFFYNLLSAILKGLGDSKTPLFSVIVAFICNVIGDLITIGYLGMGAAGAAIATVFAQFMSVVLSLVFLYRKKLITARHDFSDIKFDKKSALSMIEIGLPITVQKILVTISFVFITIIINSLGVVMSAGAGVAEKLCSFILLVPSACMASLTVFVAQNKGSCQHDRAKKAFGYMVACSFAVSAIFAFGSFFYGKELSALFTKDAEVIVQSAEYLKAFSLDCLMVSALYGFLGYYNGYACTKFVLVQGLVGSFFVRIPFAYFMSRCDTPSLFRVALSIPVSAAVQILICIIYLPVFKKKCLEGSDGRN